MNLTFSPVVAVSKQPSRCDGLTSILYPFRRSGPVDDHPGNQRTEDRRGYQEFGS
jgi:hypothetical protein